MNARMSKRISDLKQLKLDDFSDLISFIMETSLPVVQDRNR